MFFSFKFRINICMCMFVSMCVRNMLTSFMREKVKYIRNTSENLFQISLMLLQFSTITIRGFLLNQNHRLSEVEFRDRFNWFFSLQTTSGCPA